LHELETNEVRVWTVAVAALGGPSLAAAAAILDHLETERAARKRVAEDRGVFEVAHALVRLALSSVAPVEPAAWKFREEARGRPVLSGEHGLDLRFSLSHTRGLAACAIALGRDLGVDVEDLERRPFTPALERSCFTDQELASLDGLAPGRRSAERLALFTLKEAYLKARGVGLTLDLRSFAFALDPPLLLTAPPGDDAATWHLARHLARPHHTVAVAARRPAGETLAIHFFEGLPAEPLGQLR
jgi:4'-phosphopantetheinyl transferase